MSRISRATDSFFYEGASTPGSDAAGRWLEENPFDADYWQNMESHPDYHPEINPEALNTTPGVTGHQGTDTYHYTPEDYAQPIHQADEPMGRPHHVYSLSAARERFNGSDAEFNQRVKALRREIRADPSSAEHYTEPGRTIRENNIISLTMHQLPQVSPVVTHDGFANEGWSYDPIPTHPYGNPSFTKRVNGVLYRATPTDMGDWELTHNPEPYVFDGSRRISHHRHTDELRSTAERRMNDFWDQGRR